MDRFQHRRDLAARIDGLYRRRSVIDGDTKAVPQLLHSCACRAENRHDCATHPQNTRGGGAAHAQEAEGESAATRPQQAEDGSAASRPEEIAARPEQAQDGAGCDPTTSWS